MVRSNNLFFGIIGTLALAIAAINLKNMQLDTSITDQNEEITITGKEVIPTKKDLLGTYTVKGDSKSKLTLKNDGTYQLVIDVCDSHLKLSGKYELRDKKLILITKELNNEKYKENEDLYKNEELTFKIIDEFTIQSGESLVCTQQGTLFEK